MDKSHKYKHQQAIELLFSGQGSCIFLTNNSQKMTEQRCVNKENGKMKTVEHSGPNVTENLTRILIGAVQRKHLMVRTVPRLHHSYSSRTVY